MKPFDDMIPEEMEQQNEELLASLQQVYRGPVHATPTEQTRIIANVRERLLRANQGISEAKGTQPLSLPLIPSSPHLLQPGEDQELFSSSNEDVPVQQGQMYPSPGKSEVRPATAHRGSRVLRVVNTLAAVLIIGTIIGASLLLFIHRPQSIGAPPVGPVGTPVTVHTEAGGLEMSMSLTPGPYFLSEMLAVDISLTNHTNTTFTIGLPFVPSPCGYIPGVSMTGGGEPYYVVPIPTVHPCPSNLYTTPLNPGQTLAVHKYLPLISSGQVTLTTEASFYTAAARNQIPFPTPTSSALDGHWPSTQINVSSKVPSDRKLSFSMDRSRVIVHAPPEAQSHLVYLYGVDCQDFQGSGRTFTGNYAWEPISTNEVNQPGCPGKNVHWDFAFGAPGCAIVSGSYPASRSGA